MAWGYARAAASLGVNIIQNCEVRATCGFPATLRSPRVVQALESGSRSNAIHSGIQAVIRAPVGSIAFHQLPLSGSMFQGVTRFLESRYSGALACKNAEGVALQLLCYTIAELGQASESWPPWVTGNTGATRH